VYQGPERRHNTVLVTHHTEYHCRDGVCVAVRDRKTGEFIRDHLAIGRHNGGTIRFNDNGGIADAHAADDPMVGEQICFSSNKLDDPGNILTSALDEVGRPAKDVVASYPIPTVTAH
jgi:hypothetical protein